MQIHSRRCLMQYSSAWCGAAQLEENPESDVARTDPWEVFGFRLHPGEEVVCRVHEARTGALVMMQGIEPACLAQQHVVSRTAILQ